MALSLLFFPVLVAFALVIISVPIFTRFFRNIGVVGTDQQKKGKPLLTTSGGMPVALSFFAAMLLLIALNTFFLKIALDMSLLMAAVLSTLAIALIGFFDDLHVKQTKQVNASGAHDFRAGLPQWSKPLLTLVAAVPLMAVEAGITRIYVPLIGSVDFGLAYPLLLVPIGVVCVSNAANMLAGTNGLETGMLGVACAGLGLWAFMHGEFEGAAIALVGASALIGFLMFNKYPARMLPGDSLTYFAGAVFISAAIAGNVEKFAFYAFLPWIIEAFLKLRGRFAVRSYGDLQTDGSIKSPYPKIYSLTHVVMKLGERLGKAKIIARKGFTEKQVTGVLVGAEVVLVLAFLFAVQ